MNILIDLLPNKVSIEDKEYEINSDFRTSILFELLMQDDNLSEEDKLYYALSLYYPILPQNISKAVEEMLWFYKCGKEVDNNNSSRGKNKVISQIYSFDYDDEYIYSAFLDQYGLDLQDIEFLHWWKFKAMFKALKEDNEIVKIIGYRSIDLSKVKDKSQREYYKNMKQLYEIPKSKNELEKINEIEEALLNGKDLSKIL